MIPVYIFWLGLAILFGIVEAATLGLTSIWFALGALAAMIAALCKAHLLVQIALFVIVSGVAVYLTRGLGDRLFNDKVQATNADRILGQRCQVLEDIDNAQATGVVKVDGKIWTARSVSGKPIPAGTTVVIRAIEGVKVMVVPAD